MRTNFPVTFEAVFCGKSGSGGEFLDRETGDMVEFSDAFAFDFDDSEGNVQRVNLRVKKLAEVADFDPGKLRRYQDAVRLTGNVVTSDVRGDGGYFKVTQATIVKRQA